MYLNDISVTAILPIWGLTLTLDVFKSFLYPLSPVAGLRLTLTLDVFKSCI